MLMQATMIKHKGSCTQKDTSKVGRGFGGRKGVSMGKKRERHERQQWGMRITKIQ